MPGSHVPWKHYARRKSAQHPTQAAQQTTACFLHSTRSLSLPLRRHTELIEPLTALLGLEACLEQDRPATQMIVPFLKSRWRILLVVNALCKGAVQAQVHRGRYSLGFRAAPMKNCAWYKNGLRAIIEEEQGASHYGEYQANEG